MACPRIWRAAPLYRFGGAGSRLVLSQLAANWQPAGGHVHCILTARNGNRLSCLGVIVLFRGRIGNAALPSQPEEGESSELLRRKPLSSKTSLATITSISIRQSSNPSLGTLENLSRDNPQAIATFLSKRDRTRPLRPHKTFKKNPLAIPSSSKAFLATSSSKAFLATPSTSKKPPSRHPRRKPPSRHPQQTHSLFGRPSRALVQQPQGL
ncbi:hypothetical protein LA080_004823 [Diaporthe eres]|nr:hypothetical protein LA080_004823 [Diaporthe eres]